MCCVHDQQELYQRAGISDPLLQTQGVPSPWGWRRIVWHKTPQIHLSAKKRMVLAIGEGCDLKWFRLKIEGEKPLYPMMYHHVHCYHGHFVVSSMFRQTHVPWSQRTDYTAQRIGPREQYHFWGI